MKKQSLEVFELKNNKLIKNSTIIKNKIGRVREIEINAAGQIFFLSNNKSALVMFYELLFELSMADGYLDPTEEKILNEAIPIFGLDPDLFNLNKRKFGADISDAYAVLGVTKDMSYKEIKTAYQRKRKEFHPDTLLSKGLPDELLEKAKEKFIEIQAAYEEIEKKNKLK